MVDLVKTEDFWDFDSLVQETFALVHAHSDPEEEQVTEGAPLSDGPGVLFRLEQGINTFCLRGVACQDLEESYLKVVSGRSEELGHSLRWGVEQDESELILFETDSLECAQSVIETLINRRFPLKEESLFNLSDPGFSWWMREDSEGLQVYFSSHGIEGEDNLIRLGPMGDRSLAVHFFNQCLSDLQELFVVKDFAVSDRGLRVVPVKPDCSGFLRFKSLFVEGDISKLKSEKILSVYLNKLSHKRKLWLQVEKILSCPNQ